MRLFYSGIASLLMLFTTQAFAVLLSYPVDQMPECNQSYEQAREPKLESQIFSKMNEICVEKGGIRVNTQYIRSGNSSEPYDVILNCIGENPSDYIMFTCTFSTFKD
ncbi:hypothetical protein [Legionella quateirensis]|uniref:Uncharacterized protein n=1 Tax=Legionella quateirensis TaxID=45072 RepID=A0A378KQR5_9GAMM|nr:hypothetical protein [Legionella quateirensis]KTD54735.1 hypothetical protein Lqua_0242 [Legionella quateirensis]STY16915.1 Uncharacterised protein [Legionella quateirensis]